MEYSRCFIEEIFSVFILAYAVNLLCKAITSQRKKEEYGRKIQGAFILVNNEECIGADIIAIAEKNSI